MEGRRIQREAVTPPPASTGPVCIDCHAHLYPEYDAGLALRLLGANLSRLSPLAVMRIAVLTEGSSFHVYRRLRDGDVSLLPEGFAATPCEGDESVRIHSDDRGDIVLIAGRQVVTRERIEVLSLAAAPTGLDQQPACEAIDGIRSAGGIAVVSWAPGKWFGPRGRLVRQLIASASPGALLIGDTSLRCLGWPEPLIFRQAQSRGMGIVSGSDPLPLAGEERRMGSYGILINQPFDRERPAAALRRLLAQPDGAWRSVGERLTPIGMVHRLLRLKRRNRSAQTPPEMPPPFGRREKPA